MIYILIALCLYITFTNFKTIARYKHGKGFMEVYNLMLDDSSAALPKIDEYIEKEESEEFKNKAKLLKLYAHLENGLDVKEVLESLDYNALFYKKGVLDEDLLKFNSDAFMWSILSLSKANQLNDVETMKIIMDKINAIKGLDKRLEVALINGIYNVFTTKDNYDFLRKLLMGEYTGYSYDKGMIGVFKRLSAATLAYLDELCGNSDLDFYKDDLINFNKMVIGKTYMKNLGIGDRFVEEVKEELIEETNVEEENNKE